VKAKKRNGKAAKRHRIFARFPIFINDRVPLAGAHYRVTPNFPRFRFHAIEEKSTRGLTRSGATRVLAEIGECCEGRRITLPKVNRRRSETTAAGASGEFGVGRGFSFKKNKAQAERQLRGAFPWL
jgi:hypothetical protein